MHLHFKDASVAVFAQAKAVLRLHGRGLRSTQQNKPWCLHGLYDFFKLLLSKGPFTRFRLLPDISCNKFVEEMLGLFEQVCDSVDLKR